MFKNLRKFGFIAIILAPVFAYANNQQNIISGLEQEITRYSDFNVAYLYLFVVVIALVFASGYIFSKLSKR